MITFKFISRSVLDECYRDILISIKKEILLLALGIDSKVIVIVKLSIEKNWP